MTSAAVTIVTESGQNYTVDLSVTGACTYGELKDALSRTHRVDTHYHQLLTHNEGDSDLPSVPLDDRASVDPSLSTLLLKAHEVDLRIVDKNPVNPDLTCYPSEKDVFSFPIVASVADTKAQFLKEMSETLPVLTFRGQVLHDDQRLYEIGVAQGAGQLNILTGRISVIVMDVETERQTKLEELNDSMTVADIKSHYARKERRVNIDKADISLRRDENDSGPIDADVHLSDSQTLYDSGVVNDSLLHIKTPAYTVSIREQGAVGVNQGNSLDVLVFDHYTPHQIKEEYNKLSTNVLTGGDTLVYNDEVIGDNTELYKLRLKDRAIIYVNREDVTMARFDYLCADCGNDVKLKKTDAVRCRDCGHRVLYKKRTNKPCQYLAR